ncbi:hypothetical protein [Glaciihabitans sp. UYNi722]|uniref:hypothetical protein n=1 Tax=Glaciihabitans sp. UYNi722 TaxID=3156344 RepID=UPI003396907D
MAGWCHSGEQIRRDIDDKPVFLDIAESQIEPDLAEFRIDAIVYTGTRTGTGTGSGSEFDTICGPLRDFRRVNVGHTVRTGSGGNSRGEQQDH